MRYLPKSPADREAMLKAIGARSIDDLFSPIPSEYRLARDLHVPRQMAESEIVDWFKLRSKENGDDYTSFLGAGAYLHYRPGGMAERGHGRGGLLCGSIGEGVSGGMGEPPRVGDIIAMEGQSFGVPMGFGGPYCGVIATKERFVRQMPGRLAGQTVDKKGKRGYVLTLATREQHIRREKATSNICTNQALVALMVNIFMTVYGKVGLKDLAKQNLAKTAYAASQFGKSARVLFAGTPRFNEFVVETSEDPYAINSRLLGHKIVGGLPLKKFYPELGNAALWCCTELTTRSAIDTAVGLVAESERSMRSAKEEVDAQEVAR